MTALIIHLLVLLAIWGSGVYGIGYIFVDAGKMHWKAKYVVRGLMVLLLAVSGIVVANEGRDYIDEYKVAQDVR